MQPIDYIYRFDPKNPTVKPPPHDAESARQRLEEGNRIFARWIATCQGSEPAGGESVHVVQCNANQVGMVRLSSGQPKQAPFAVVVGCSDARVSTEMIFGQGFNDLFIIRVAGNVLGDVCLGSIDFAVTALSESVRVLVVLGHASCGAVTGAVDAYLQPNKFWSRSVTPPLRSIMEKLFVAVRAAANGLKEVWGAEVGKLPGYRDALIETAVCVNAAHAAFDMRQVIEKAGKYDIQVVYAVYNLYTHQVNMPLDLHGDPSRQEVRLAFAPTSPTEFEALAMQMGRLLRPTLEGKPVLVRGDANGRNVVGQAPGSRA
jgi:carbonic anhydrase